MVGQEKMTGLEALKIVVGSLVLLFLPGFAWSYIFFAEKEADLVIRVALSFGLSVALVPLTVFWLNWLFKVRIDLVNSLIASAVLTAIPLLYLQMKKEKEARK